MKVTPGYNPYGYRQQTGKAKDSSDKNVNVAGKNERQHNSERAPIQTQDGNLPRLERRDCWSFQSGKHTSHRMDVNDCKTRPRQPNADSKGNHSLTQAQAFDLKDRYDLENLTPQARHSLLCDLTDLGVLSAADLEAEDQSKVDAVLAGINAQNMGVLTYVEAPEQSEITFYDGPDYEFSALRDEDKFAAIVKSYNGGTTHTSFVYMVSKLYTNKVITEEQMGFLRELEMNIYDKERAAQESEQGDNFDIHLFNQDYRVTMNQILDEAKRIKELSNSTGQDISPLYDDPDFLKDFAAKVSIVL